MSLLFSRVSTVDGPGAIPRRPVSTGRGYTYHVDNDSAMRHSAVWACLRLRNDLISTMPVEVYRRMGKTNALVPTPPVLVTPGGSEVEIHEWMYSSGVDLDRAGNCFGLITARDGMGYPSRIELQDLSTTAVIIKGGKIRKFRFGHTEYEPTEVWHEKQFTVSGLPVGLSPVSYAALSIGQYLSAQQFAMDWFGGGAIPAAELKNVNKTITPTESAEIKDRFNATVGVGDVFVHGSDWEYKPLNAIASDAQWINTQQHGIPDISRFFGCPADLIDAAVSTGSITYATITQRNLQLLIMNIGPQATRRERALSRLVPDPRFAKLNREAILAMDPETRGKYLVAMVDGRLRTPTEARAADNLLPYTDADYAEFDRLFGGPKQTPTIASTGATA